MSLPETIPVKYTEEEAGYVSMRPVVRQTFTAPELVDMIVRVAGKDAARIQQILRSGTVVFHSFRYWWPGFEADSTGLSEILAHYPDPQSSRVFQPSECTEVILESSGVPARHSLHVRREDANRKRLFRSRSFWDCLMDTARDQPPMHREYSYASRADIFVQPLESARIARLAHEALRYASPSLRAQLDILSSFSQITFVCPRR